ncbi:unnamed protein product [Urochloa decumbens]|uniref:Uncharacterized protein n=1 Tax=Urochloa decumbens TaxID=240449 RepID=A0ABC8VMD6_9POAL
MATVAALNGTILVAAVLLVLLQSSVGRHPGPGHRCPDDDYTGQQPAAAGAHRCPDDTEQALAPAPTPTPTPAPAPAVDCPLYCSMQCRPLCDANRNAGYELCQANLAANGTVCYDVCTTNSCPDKCVDSGCSFSNCTCDNSYARSCCSACGQGLLPTYSSCLNHYDRAVGYCMIDCQNECSKNCTQG